MAENAVDILRSGGLVAYPTEAVYGIGCDPFSEAAIARLRELKDRPEGGFIALASDFRQVEPWLELASAAHLHDAFASWPGPHTWIFEATDRAPKGILSTDGSIAVRVSAHPVAIALARAFEAALVSTSANRKGSEPARSVEELAPIKDYLDWIIEGEVDLAARPTTIRDARTGAIVRE